MVYFNFNKIVPPKPNDPTVDEMAALNNNWDVLDAGITPYINGGTISNIEQGQEFYGPGSTFAVWDGAATRTADDITSAWSAWTNLPLNASRAIRSGFQPKWRNNSLLRMVELAGGFQADASATAFTPGNIYFVTADVAGGIPQSMAPNGGGATYRQCATALTAGTAVVASGYIIIDKPGAETHVRLRSQYLGGSGGGNFIQLDQVWWWY